MDRNKLPDNKEELPHIPEGLKDTREEGYCWRVVDREGNVVTHLTMDWSAELYEDGIAGTDEIHIISWEVE